MATINVFYNEKMSADSKSYSPSAAKPKLAVESWLKKYPVNIKDFLPATQSMLSLAHDADYVRGVLGCRIPNGFHNKSRLVAQSLPFTTGATVAAAIDAIETGGFSCAPTSGFHHAAWGNGSGFCTFNGLMVAALHVLDLGLVESVGILDCDQHYGNGTDNIIKTLGVDNVAHYSAGASRHKASVFLENLPRLIEDMFKDCGVLLYQAGADPHINDPLGGWLTTEQLLERDTIVFETCRKIGLPCAWNLAGGYQVDSNGGIPKVLEIHDNTMAACLKFIE
jgi:acetoin utilization deacetylase AcuC-like enzyme